MHISICHFLHSPIPKLFKYLSALILGVISHLFQYLQELLRKLLSSLYHTIKLVNGMLDGAYLVVIVAYNGEGAKQTPLVVCYHGVLAYPAFQPFKLFLGCQHWVEVFFSDFHISSHLLLTLPIAKSRFFMAVL